MRSERNYDKMMSLFSFLCLNDTNSYTAVWKREVHGLYTTTVSIQFTQKEPCRFDSPS